MDFHFVPYSATGNLVGVAYYPALFHVQQFADAPYLRKGLKRQALRNNCDSVMVLVRTADGLQATVFEPNGGDTYGALSAMCGNGVRAVAAFVEERFEHTQWPLSLDTQSGTLQIHKISDNSYRVLMGKAVSERGMLAKYVDLRRFEDSPQMRDIAIPEDILSKLPALPFGPKGAVCSIGFTTTSHRASADGEPHLVIQLDGQIIRTIEDLREIAYTCGPLLSLNTHLFPVGMNINFVAPVGSTPHEFLICTFERNLGEDPRKAVTQACGTGSTFAGAERMRMSESSKVMARCLGGELTIENEAGALYMSGGVAKV